MVFFLLAFLVAVYGEPQPADTAEPSHFPIISPYIPSPPGDSPEPTPFPTYFPTSSTSCDRALNLALLTSPYSSSTIASSNDYATSCGGRGREVIFFAFLQPGETISIRQIGNSFDSRHELRYGTEACPGTTSIACRDDPDTQLETWTNDQGGVTKVWFMIDAYQTQSGRFTIEWNIGSGGYDKEVASVARLCCKDVKEGYKFHECTSSMMELAQAGTDLGKHCTAEKQQKIEILKALDADNKLYIELLEQELDVAKRTIERLNGKGREKPAVDL